MPVAPNAIRVDGAKALARNIRKLQDKELKKELRAANKGAAKIVADQAKVEAPKRSGKLAKSVGAQSTDTYGRVKAGTAKGVQYAGPIHFGWPSRNIRPQPFIYDALDDRIQEVRDNYEENISKVTDKVIGSRGL